MSRPPTIKKLIEKWFVVNRDGQLKFASNRNDARKRQALLNQVEPSYAPHRIIFMREAVPDLPNPKKIRL